MRGATLAVCAWALVALVTPCGALARTERQHRFSFAFGSKGPDVGQFSDPDGVAVSTATGDVYVADRKNARVQQFVPVRERGLLVGETPIRSFAVSAPQGVAVDDSSEARDASRGDVYVVSGGKRVLRVSAEGVLLAELKRFEVQGVKRKLEQVTGVAVDSHGTLYVSQADGRVYAFPEGEAAGATLELKTGFRGAPGLALDDEGDVFLGEVGEDGFPVVAEVEGETGRVLVAALDDEPSSAVAVNVTDAAEATGVDERDDAYVVNGGGREEASTVAQFGPGVEGASGALLQRFGAPGLREGDSVAVDGADGTVFLADAASDDVDVFELELPGPPTVADPAVSSASPPVVDGRRLSAQLNPMGAETHREMTIR